MMAWAQSRRDNRVPTLTSARNFSPEQLESFAVELFRRMGYRVVHTGRSGDHGVDVHLTNPNGQVELVQCKQWFRRVGEPEVRELVGAMAHEHAVRCYLLAPGGFSAAAYRWVKHWKNSDRIVLADEEEINRLVQIAFLRE
jgi:restriction endonuclease Mrr